jgi:hypothetical protein
MKLDLNRQQHTDHKLNNVYLASNQFPESPSRHQRHNITGANGNFTGIIVHHHNSDKKGEISSTMQPDLATINYPGGVKTNEHQGQFELFPS